MADLLKETEKEESNADKNLSKIAEGGILSAGINQNAINEQEELPKRKTSDKQKSSGFMSQFEIQEEPPLKKKIATATKSRTSKATPSKKPVKVTAQKKTSNQEKKKFALPKTSVPKETTTRSFLRG